MIDMAYRYSKQPYLEGAVVRVEVYDALEVEGDLEDQQGCKMSIILQTPNPTFLHRYLCPICDILQLRGPAVVQIQAVLGVKAKLVEFQLVMYLK